MGMASRRFKAVASGISHLVGVPSASNGKVGLMMNLFKEASPNLGEKLTKMAKGIVHKVRGLAPQSFPRATPPSLGNK